MSNRNIPVVRLAKYVHGTSTEKTAFIQEVGQAFNEIGFVAVADHGIEQSLIDTFFSSSQAFFALPVDQKRQYEIEGMAGQRGYTSFGVEHAKQSEVPDLKEFYQFGQEAQPAADFKPQTHPNVPVEEVPDFTNSGLELYRAFEEAGGHLLRAIAEYLGLPADYFEHYTQGGNSILRSIHYPPITQEPASAIRAEQHEDINLITLLVGASAGGLQLLDKQGEWLDIMPEDNEIVINVGDMLQRLTNDKLKSTTHRVVNPPRERWHEPRLSIPFFLHPVSEMPLYCLDSCIDADHPKTYDDMTAGQYLEERLREIGLKTK